MKPRLLDLFCGAGGAAVGYARAGFEVVGVDINPQPHYPFTFFQDDALGYIEDGEGWDDLMGFFDAIHASPPCQAYSRTGHLARAQGNEQSEIDLVGPTRDLLIAAGLPYVIENVPGAPLVDPVTLCGSMFGLAVRRHRLFESNVALMVPECQHGTAKPVGVYGKMGDEIPSGGHTAKTLQQAREAMGIDWMNWRELTQAIPPAYTELIGKTLIDALGFDAAKGER